jgi:hypothetical protein
MIDKEQIEKIKEYAQQLAEQLKLSPKPIVTFHPAGAFAYQPSRGKPVVYLYQFTPEELAHEMGHIYLFQKHPFLSTVAQSMYELRPLTMFLGGIAPLAFIREKPLWGKPLAKVIPLSILGMLAGYGIATVPKLLEEMAATRIGIRGLKQIGYQPAPGLTQREMKFLYTYAKPHIWS